MMRICLKARNLVTRPIKEAKVILGNMTTCQKAKMAKTGGEQKEIQSQRRTQKAVNLNPVQRAIMLTEKEEV